ncbi:hypothetical protein JNB71_07000 [Rhizobium herbae]|uniref:Uncharacterized protein n=1 Tax=Rhizobium herbae TaxID=508661 RepID=A0ABS7H7I2_9HYPH|nr:hypothetical protein [Rhizobium herbae]MBW9063063.1 hypothetical protein [Rhizobium herbae]
METIMFWLIGAASTSGFLITTVFAIVAIVQFTKRGYVGISARIPLSLPGAGEVERSEMRLQDGKA